MFTQRVLLRPGAYWLLFPGKNCRCGSKFVTSAIPKILFLGRVICDLGCDKLLITKGSAVLVENAVHNYGNNEHSRLRIMGPCRIVIAKLDVEASTSCRYDYLRILGVPYCKWQSNPIKLPEGEHLVHWRSNSHTTQFGFQIRVEREQPKQATTLSRSALAGDRTLRSFPDDAKNNHRAVVNKANENTGKKNETGVTPQVLAAIYMPENATQDANQANDELSGSGEVMNESHHVERLKSASSKSTSTAAIVLGAGGISLMAVGIGCLCAWYVKPPQVVYSQQLNFFFIMFLLHCWLRARNAKKENPFVEAGFGTGYDYGDTSLTWGLPPGRR